MPIGNNRCSRRSICQFDTLKADRPRRSQKLPLGGSNLRTICELTFTAPFEVQNALSQLSERPQLLGRVSCLISVLIFCILHFLSEIARFVSPLCADGLRPYAASGEDEGPIPAKEGKYEFHKHRPLVSVLKSSLGSSVSIHNNAVPINVFGSFVTFLWKALEVF